MFTPQQIEEQTFVKAVFGGYDMQSVDDFLGPLTEDYVVLYKENAVLKSKMKVLVEKLEEYRSQEDSMKKALMAAQQTADNMIAATQKKCARMLNDAQKTLEGQHTGLRQQIQGEQTRLKEARGAVQEYITKLQVELEELKTRQMVEAEPVAKAYDFESEPDPRPVEMARTIKMNLEKRVQEEMAQPGDVRPAQTKAPRPAQATPRPAQTTQPAPQAQTASEAPTVVVPDLSALLGQESAQAAQEPAEKAPETRTARPKGVKEDTMSKFADLQFGKNYDPKAK